ncbi:Hypothetical protein LBF_2164 [Leptospira biflexa serovar Patoc strain 'Patoc 1 (Ames)']|uniref:Knr4/Smi1-like domain-containing protein n=1 Tax=Leptospira biflexa serovar Patoc (strain Patoc 1 / ATCC 23582 / Paris) TaxID=456481 RepID=B0ST83_LEPBP|nr:SMI1/KNR4 family protein [Leptospira biflexa]ABZ94661.1 Hypothetical protein LBF_2164 [Leptospira biflexa serovar Patoc strain 'Patoc 1 (Ames)']ABZ98323.1 Hypothetical protein LEPBI_I2226 [Leptospira biflexa serovar Patoc strain 'Patoc 1 (Paris)']
MFKNLKVVNFLNIAKAFDKLIIKISNTEFIPLGGFFENLEETEKIMKITDGGFLQGIFPIAIDQGGNLICYSDGQTLSEGVYFWDHEQYDQRERAYEFIASDLQVLEKMLVDETDEEYTSFIES